MMREMKCGGGEGGEGERLSICGVSETEGSVG